MIRETIKRIRSTDYKEIITNIKKIDRKVIKEQLDLFKGRCMQAYSLLLGNNPEAIRDRIVGAHLRHIPEEYKIIVKQMLENTYDYIKGCETNKVGENKKLMMLVTRHIAVELCQSFNNIIGIQPMSGPVGLIYKLRVKDSDVTDGAMTIEIMKDTVEAASRKLQAGYSVEAVTDMTALHGAGAQEEFAQALAAEVVQEYTEEILQDLTTLGEKESEVPTFTVDSASFVNKRKVQDDIDNLVLLISHSANEIARKTRRGAGNVIVVDLQTLTLLKHHSEFEDAKEKTSTTTGLMYAGTLLNNIKVYTSLCFNNKIIIGYKGGRGEMDAGYFLTPYVACMSTGVVADRDTFAPIVKFMTRYGKHADVGVAENYFGVINIKTK